MRLINLKTRRLEEVSDDELLLMKTVTAGAPPNVKNYAILSHTWTRGEISFTEYASIQEEPLAATSIQLKQKAGWLKIESFLNTLAYRVEATPWLRYVEWAWVDTCSIDKRSSAELSEAINSMYQWYSEAAICFAYLEDVDFAESEINADAKPFAYSVFHSSSPIKWLTRGWTLQEMIAPREVYFFDRKWQFVGSKRAPVTLDALSSATKIPQSILLGELACSATSVAERMQWASSRQTTRREDEAYCLMGLFDINMPLLYGEGSKAFLRLQEAIMATHNDHTIFTWKQSQSQLRSVYPALASSAGDFRDLIIGESAHTLTLRRNMSYLEIIATNMSGAPPLPYQVTNTGLQIRLPVATTQPHRGNGSAHCLSECQLALLNVVASCTVPEGRDNELRLACIYLKRRHPEGVYARAHADRVEWLDTKSILKFFKSDGSVYWHTLATEELYLQIRTVP